jgi:excisionase family DNA binding protein
MSNFQNEVAASPASWWAARQRPETQTRPEAQPSYSPLVTVREAARQLAICTATVRKMLAAGVIRGVRYSPRSRWKVPISEICRIGSLKRPHDAK